MKYNIQSTALIRLTIIYNLLLTLNCLCIYIHIQYTCYFSIKFMILEEIKYIYDRVKIQDDFEKYYSDIWNTKRERSSGSSTMLIN